MNGHTKGPWRIRTGDSVVFIDSDEGDNIAATNSKPYFRRFDERDEANATLMASAPDMLEALEALTSAAPVVEAYDHAVADCDCAFCLARAAIAKATGDA